MLNDPVKLLYENLICYWKILKLENRILKYLDISSLSDTYYCVASFINATIWKTCCACFYNITTMFFLSEVVATLLVCNTQRRTTPYKHKIWIKPHGPIVRKNKQTRTKAKQLTHRVHIRIRSLVVVIPWRSAGDALCLYTSFLPMAYAKKKKIKLPNKFIEVTHS